MLIDALWKRAAVGGENTEQVALPGKGELITQLHAEQSLYDALRRLIKIRINPTYLMLCALHQKHGPIALNDIQPLVRGVVVESKNDNLKGNYVIP